MDDLGKPPHGGGGGGGGHPHGGGGHPASHGGGHPFRFASGRGGGWWGSPWGDYYGAPIYTVIAVETCLAWGAPIVLTPELATIGQRLLEPSAGQQPASAVYSGVP